MWQRLGLIAFYCLFCGASNLFAAAPFAVGEAVEVTFQAKPRAGKVVRLEKDGAIVVVAFEAEGKAHEQPFGAHAVRRAYEAGALMPARTFTDITGRSKIDAALIKVEGDTAVLRKPDMTEIKVPLAKLSAIDQALIKQAVATKAAVAAPPVPADAGANPELQTFAADVKASTEEALREALPPDPLPASLKPKLGELSFPAKGITERVQSLHVMGGKDSLVLVVLSEGLGTTPPRLVWCSLARKRVERELPLLAGEVVLDFHPASLRLLTYSPESAGRGKPSLTLSELANGGQELKTVARWQTTATTAPWARLATGDLVLERLNKDELIAWDVPKKAARYRLKHTGGADHAAILSPGSKYVVVPGETSVHIADVETGNWVTQIPTASEAYAVGLSDDGRRLAVAERNRFAVWNLSDSQSLPKVYRISTDALEPHTTLGFLGERLMVVPPSTVTGAGRFSVFSVKHELPVWRYTVGQGIPGNHAIIGDHVLYGLNHRAQVGLAPATQQIIVGSAKLPGVNLEAGEKSLATEAKTIIQRGHEVQLVVEAGEHNAEVKAALEKRIAANGWKLVPASNTVLTAKMARGEKKRVTYQPLGGGNVKRQTATIEPYRSELRITIGDQQVFARISARGDLPDFLTLKNGETIQGLVDERQKPDVEFFSSTDLPEKISDPFHQTGGNTIIGPQPRGIGGIR